VPSGDDEGGPPEAEDEWDALARANTDTERVDGNARPISFDVALLHCELHPALGAAWIHQPGRWETTDGCVPVRIVWAYFRAIRMQRALFALDTARGIGLAFAGEEGARVFDAALDEAFPRTSEG
jgi:hypothetical protein